MSRCAAAADRTAAPVEQRQLNAGFLTGFDQRILRLVLRPRGGHYARIFSRVRVANHDHLFALNKAAVPVDIQQLCHHVIGVVQVVQRFKQRGNRQRERDTRFFQQKVYGKYIGRSFRHRDNVGRNRTLRGINNRFAGVEHFAGVVAWFPAARQQRAFRIQFTDQEGLFVGF